MKRYNIRLFHALLGSMILTGISHAEEYPGRVWVDPEKVLSGEWEKQFPAPLPANFDFSGKGFDALRLTKVPPAGVHPRVIMSPEDIERLQKEYKKGEGAGEMFRQHIRMLRDDIDRMDPVNPEKAAGGNYGGPHGDWTFSPPIQNMGLLALITQDDELGRRAAELTVKHAQYMEPIVDALNSSDQFRDNWYYFSRATAKQDEKGNWVPQYGGGSQTQFVGLGMQYDYAWKWMTEEERSLVRRVISKMTHGKYVSQMEMPGHFNMNNHMALASHFLNLVLSIEGEEGYDERILPIMNQKLIDQLSYNISEEGVMYESMKGFTPTYAILAAARRDPRLLKHNHLLKRMYSALWATGYRNKEHMVEPRHRRNLISAGEDYDGAWETARPDIPMTWTMKYFYPDDPVVDFVYKNALKGMNADVMERDKDQKLYTHSHNMTTLDIMTLFATDGFKRKDGSIEWYADNQIPDVLRDKPRGWADQQRGYMVTRSAWDPEAMIVSQECRSDFYYGGHETPDFGDLEISNNGVPWVVKPFPYSNNYMHSMLIVDGLGADFPAASAKLMDFLDTDDATISVCDIGEAYTWRLVHGGYDLSHPMYAESKWHDFNLNQIGMLDRNTELPTHPRIRKFYEGYAHKDYGSWHGENRGVIRYQKWNPMEYYFRTLFFARGAHPYLILFDDAKKDDKEHQFDWGLILHRYARLVEINDAAKNRHNRADAPPQKIGTDMLFTMSREPQTDALFDKRKLKKGDPMLLVRVLWRNTNYPFPLPGFTQINIPESHLGNPGGRVSVPAHAVDPHYRILIYPHVYGDPLPQTYWNDDRTRLTVDFDGQKDVFDLGYTDGGPNADQPDGRRVVMNVTRNGKEIANSNAAPPRPQLQDELPLSSGATRNPAIIFTDSYEAKFKAPDAGLTIHYTLDGSEPTQRSPVYSGPVTIDRDGVLKARMVAGYWPYGKEKQSRVIEYNFKKQTLAPAVQVANAQSGLECTVHELRNSVDVYNSEGFFTGNKTMMPDLSAIPAKQTVILPGLEVPQTKRSLPVQQMADSYYTYKGFIDVPRDGVYRFRLNAPGPLRLSVGGQKVIEVTGQYDLSQKDFYGEASLSAGMQPFELVVTDPVYWKAEMVPPLQIQLDAMCRAADGTWRDVSLQDRYYRSPGIRIDTAAVEVSPARVRFVLEDSDLELRAGLDRTKLEKSGTELTIDKAGTYQVYAAGYKDGQLATPLISKRINVVDRVSAVKAKCVPGVIKKVYDQYELSNRTGGLTVEGADPQMLQTEGLKPFTVETTMNLNGSDSPVALTVYEGYLRIPASGIYQFALETQAMDFGAHRWPSPAGVNQLYVASRLVAENRARRGQQAEALWLEKGLHPFSLRLIDSKATLRMGLVNSGEMKSVGIESLCRPQQAKDVASGPLMASLSFSTIGEDGRIPVKGQSGVIAEVNDAKIVPGPHGKSALSGTGMLRLTHLRSLHNAMTVSLWIKPHKTGRVVLMQGENPGLSIAHFFNMVQAYVIPGVSGTAEVTDKELIKPGEWYHLTVSFGRQVQIYINGELKGSSPIDWGIVRGANRIHTRNLDFSLQAGDLADIRVYNEVLSPEEIAKSRK